MSQEVLLMSNVQDLGSEGDVLNVSEGYARNYLFPKKLAAPVTEAMKKKLAKIQKDREVQKKAQLESAREKAASLGKVSITIPVKVNKEEKPYGSITPADISDALKKENVEIDRNLIELPGGHLKELGVFDIKIKVHPEVEAAIKVWIVKE